MHRRFLRLFLDFFENETDELTAKALAREANIQLNRGPEFSNEEWQRLFRAACKKLAIVPDVVEAAFGHFFFRFIRAQQGRIYTDYEDSRELIDHLPTIHRECLGRHSTDAKGKIPPKFQVLQVGPRDNAIIIHYTSPNELCIFLEALAGDIIKSYGDRAQITHGPRCMKHGDSRCEIQIVWEEVKKS
jgi:hypothetical protein